MQNTITTLSPKKAYRINQRYSWSISVSLRPKLFTKYHSLIINDYNKTSVTNKKANFGSARSSFVAPLRSLFHKENVRAILFLKGEFYILKLYKMIKTYALPKSKRRTNSV